MQFPRGVISGESCIQPGQKALIRTYETGTAEGGLQAKSVKLLKAHITNEFPRIFGRRFRDLGMNQAAIQSFISPAIGAFSTNWYIFFHVS